GRRARGAARPHLQRRAAVPRRRPRAPDVARSVSRNGARLAGVVGPMSTPTPRFEIDGLLADPLAASRGGIGFVGPDVPVDVLLASGRPFGHLPWRATGAIGAIGATGATGAAGATPWADRWL